MALLVIRTDGTPDSVMPIWKAITEEGNVTTEIRGTTFRVSSEWHVHLVRIARALGFTVHCFPAWVNAAHPSRR